jgi:glycosyltransferase involved in cell wall biosynthesis
MYNCLRHKGHDVVPVDASLRGLRRGIAAITSASTNRDRWRSRFRYGSTAARHRTLSAKKSLGRRTVDVILQVGASYNPPSHIPYAIYSDWNMALDAEDARANRTSRGMGVQELERVGKEHARRYREAAAIFTISERLRQSFIELYGISPDKIHTAYAGPNLDSALINEALTLPKPLGAPTVLFIAKEFHRKGGDTVAAAVKAIPGVRLLFAGTAGLPSEFADLENVEHLGVLDKRDPSQLTRLLQAYREADVLVLPSRHDPFPTVIREAMFFGLPCIASNIWAMPEMIIDGKTGFLVPPNDPVVLSDRLRTLLWDSKLRERFGVAAKARASGMFTWASVGNVLDVGLRSALSSPTRTGFRMSNRQKKRHDM